MFFFPLYIRTFTPKYTLSCNGHLIFSFACFTKLTQYLPGLKPEDQKAAIQYNTFTSTDVAVILPGIVLYRSKLQASGWTRRT